MATKTDRWVETPWTQEPADRQPTLLGEQSADIAIVGGGFAGLSAALHLQKYRPDLDIAVIEKDYCGFGSSGRNAGHLTPTIGKDIFTLFRFFGRRWGGELARFGDRAVLLTEQLIRDLGIECDYEQTGNVMAGVHESQAKILRKSADAAQEIGADVAYLDESAMRAMGLPDAFVCGAHERAGGTLNPGKYVAGLRSEVLQRGVRIYEQTAVTKVDGLHGASPVHVHTTAGSMKAKHLILTTNAYSRQVLGLWGWVVPVRVTLFRTRPLTPDEWQSIHWHGRQGIYTAHEVMESWRPTADQRILGGSKCIQYRFGSRLPAREQPTSARELTQVFAERFPTLRNVPIEDWWGGWIALTLDFLPIYETLGQDKHVHCGIGFNGHGIAQGTLMGKMLAESVLGERTADHDVLKRWRIRFPPEPFRWLVFHALYRTLKFVDARTDAKVRRR